MKAEGAFQNDWVSSPSHTISDLLNEKQISIDTLLKRSGWDREFVTLLMAGHIRIGSDVAEILAKNVGATKEFWKERERQYLSDCLRLKVKTSEQRNNEWIRSLPTKEMLDFGWIIQDQKSLLVQCLDFFGVQSHRDWHKKYDSLISAAMFRISSAFRSEPLALAAWIRKGEIEADKVKCDDWSPSKFRLVLNEIRQLTLLKDPTVFLPQLQKKCAECGVAVSIVRAPKGCKASGVTRFLNSKKAMLVLSFRYLSDDHFWFTFFHEAAHLLLHDPKAIFLEGEEMEVRAEEDEANIFAAEMLIPHHRWEGIKTTKLTYKNIIRLAVQIGISPGILVGQLQHRRLIDRNKLNFLKRRFSWD